MTARPLIRCRNPNLGSCRVDALPAADVRAVGRSIRARVERIGGGLTARKYRIDAGEAKAEPVGDVSAALRGIHAGSCRGRNVGQRPDGEYRTGVGLFLLTLFNAWLGYHEEGKAEALRPLWAR